MPSEKRRGSFRSFVNKGQNSPVVGQSVVPKDRTTAKAKRVAEGRGGGRGLYKVKTLRDASWSSQDEFGDLRERYQGPRGIADGRSTFDDFLERSIRMRIRESDSGTTACSKGS